MAVADVRGHRGRVDNASVAVDVEVPGGVDAILDQVSAAIASLSPRA